MRKIACLSLAFLLAACCSSNQQEVTRYHEDGRAKPMIAIASMIDTTSFDVPWSISEELTAMIASQVSKSGSIYVSTRDDSSLVENPFSGDLLWTKREFSDQEFAVFLELVEHENAPSVKDKKGVKPQQDVSSNLNMGVRVRIVDVRGATPKIVLQEMIRDSYYIPKTILPTDYNQVIWGTDEYSKTPMGIAHAQLVQDIAGRISEYVTLAKSR